MKKYFLLASLCLSGIFIFFSCKHEIPKVTPATDNNFPPEIANILVNKCATAGCHNDVSYVGCGDLRLDAWDEVFKGSSNGSVVIPYSPENSSLLFFTNVDPNLGPTALPVMPYDPTNPNVGHPLTTDEYITLRDWIAKGAPDKNGNIAFSGNPQTRQKIYITMQGCDQVAVVDAASRLVMRYISVGADQAKIEVPHCVRTDLQGRYAYVSFLDGDVIQKIDMNTDSVIAAANVGPGYWNIVQVSPDGTQLLTTDWESVGKAVLIDAQTMQVYPTGTVTNLLQPHGIACNPDHTFFVTSESKNVIYKISFTAPFIKEVKIGNLGGDSLITHDIVMLPDYSKYFVTCRASNEVRVIDANADTVIKVIPVGQYPQEVVVSKTRPYVFVSCMEDNGAAPGFRGCVYAINYITYEKTRIDGPFYQPHGVAVDDANGVLYIVSANISQDGPPPHHVSGCGGKNGYYNTYDLNTFQKLPTRNEVTVAPYSADVRFK